MQRNGPWQRAVAPQRAMQRPATRLCNGEEADQTSCDVTVRAVACCCSIRRVSVRPATLDGLMALHDIMAFLMQRHGKLAVKVFGYARVSTAEQSAHGDSLETQRQQIIGYAMMKGWTVDEIFVERGVSGSIPLGERPEGAKLLEAVAKGDAIVTPKLDRMFRSAADALVTLEAAKDQRVTLHMIDLGGDVTGNGIGKLTFTILSAVAENERDRIRERIRDVKRHLANQGVYCGGKRPFGFDIVEGATPDAAKVLVKNNAEQAVLAKMRARREAGDSYAKIGAMVGKDAKSVMRMLANEAKA
jgi:putative DNA-invertase from lambdoid prophage Rac